MATEKVDEAKTASQIPPYVPYRTFKNFIDGLREIGGAPGRIDRSVMPNLSGAVQGQLMAALRYMDLITPNGQPTEHLRQLLAADGANQKAALRDLLTRSYGFLFATTEFDPRSASSSQLSSAFAATGASGETVRKCIAFLLLAAQDADMPLSPYFKAGRAPRASNPRPKRIQPRRAAAEPSNGHSLLRPAPTTLAAPSSLRKEIQGALAQLPEGEASLSEEEIDELVTVYRIALRRAYLFREPRA